VTPPTVPDWLVDAFVAQLSACGLGRDEVVVVLRETDSRQVLVDAARLAASTLGAEGDVVAVPTPAPTGALPVRSTGASRALTGRDADVARLAAADVVVDCTVEGLLHARELPSVLADGARVLMVSNEHPEVFARVAGDVGLADRVRSHLARLHAAAVMQVTSAAGTDLTISLEGSMRAGSDGTVTEAGGIAHWPGGLVLAFPAAGRVSGTRRPRRRAVRVVPRRVGRAGRPRRQPRGLGAQPGVPLGGARVLRQGRHERHRAACVRRQLPVLDGRERGGGAVLHRSSRPPDAGVHGDARR
jgi:hypothetical protein